MRVPFVAYIGQRGGPSTGTVIYSQQELNLARNGGNGEAMRLVLGPSNLQELYEFTLLAFDWAWKYHLPVIILGDGYLSKMTGVVDLKKKRAVTEATPIVQNGERVMNLRNCYSQEEELGRVLKRELTDYGQIGREVEQSESFKTEDADIVIYAWGTVASAAREAVINLRSMGIKVGLFRPITLKPFSAKKAKEALRKAHSILICESSAGQFGRLVTESLFGVSGVSVERMYKPAEGIISKEIEDRIMEMLENE
jgi:2-oxoglutarate/2-oxoacid ferredoxin oxidoreductase subunit alpha